MRVEPGLVGAGELRELGERADADLVVVLAAPDRQRRAPVAPSREGPVDVVVEPVAVTAPLDRLGEPVGALVLAEQLVLAGGGADVPRRLGVVEQRGVAAPAVRIAVLVGQVAEEQPALLQVGDQGGVGVLEELPADQRHVVLEVAVGLDRVDQRQAVAAAHREVVLAEGGGLVDQAGAVLGGDVVAEHDEVRAAAVGGRGELDQLERAGVLPALHVGALDALLDLPALAEGLLEQRLGDDEGLLAVAHQHVGHLGVDRDGGVGDQRPGRGRPDQQVGPAGVRATGQGEPHVDARVDHRLVALRELVVGQAGAAAGAVRRDAVVLDQQPRLVDLLERPPDRLDVVGAHRAVGVGQVDPVAHAGRHRLELVDVAQHGLAAPVVELGDAVGLDVALAGEAELLLHRELDGQAVAVPAGLPLHAHAAHRLVAGEDVLEHAGLDVVRAGLAVGGRRTLVERPGLGALALRHRGGEGVLGGPEVEDLVLEGGEVHLGRDRAVGAHRGSSWSLRGPGPARSGRRDEARLRVPRYHPPWRPRTDRWHPLEVRRSRVYPSLPAHGSVATLFRRLGGDLRSGQHPRALTVPGSLPAVLGATRPVHALRSRQVCQRALGGPNPIPPGPPAGVARVGRRAVDGLGRAGRGWLSGQVSGHILATRAPEGRTFRPGVRTV